MSEVQKNRYISKNNQNIKRINSLINNYPDSKVIIPFREPLQHTFSLITQHKNLFLFKKMIILQEVICH